MSRSPRSILPLLVPAIVLAVMLSDAAKADRIFCERGATFQETLLTARATHNAWLAEQLPARKAVELTGWLVTPTLTKDEADKIVTPGTPADAAAKLPDGRALWSSRNDLVDGRATRFPANGGRGTVYLTRSVRAKQPTKLTVGIGGGERIDLWLDDRQVASAKTHLSSGRYGCGEWYDGTRVNQVLADLELSQGEHTLLVRMELGSEPSFYFSPSPSPVARIWEQVRHDFPAAENPILEMVPAEWFAANGWFGTENAAMEEQLISRLAADCGDDAEPVRAELGRLQQSCPTANDRRWLDLCVKTCVFASLHRDFARLRAAVTELGHMAGYPVAQMLGRLDEYHDRLSAQVRDRLDPAEETTRGLMAEMRHLQRQMLVESNPLVGNAQIVFVKRYTYNSKHFYDDFQHISRFGGNLCVLSPADGHVREIAPQLAGGVFDRYDLSFDGQRIVFGYRRPEPEGYRIYEVGVDGSGLRQVTRPPADEERRIATYGRTSYGDGFYGLQGYHFWTDDVHPCYLPDGGICFASTRSEHGVLCTPNHYLACTNLYRIDADGSRMRPLSQGALSEFTPTMMDDGRILYNRWEYVYKGIAAVQPLWTVRPDGSGGEEFYGDNIANPGVFWQARQVPGRSGMAVCIGCGHEPLGVGQVLLLDLHRNKRTRAPITSLTPDVEIRNLRGLFHLRNGVWREDVDGPLFADPYPLSDKFFLVSCNPDRRYNDPAGYGIYLLDAFGNRVPIYHDSEIACWEPMPLRARPTPPVIPQADAVAEAAAPATLFVSDVYRGLEGVPRGTVKYLRVMEQIPKPWSCELDGRRNEDRGADGCGGHLAVSWNSHIWVAVLHGVVPVREDGSVSLEVPSGRNLFFQALDENYMEVQRMRTFVNLQPGERRACIGCHEHRMLVPQSRQTLALSRPVERLAAQPGDVAPRPLYYPTDVQPTLDRLCVRCHDGKDAKSSPDLRGEPTELFSRSYENLLKGRLVATVQEWNGSDHAMQNAEALPPYSLGSHRSKLVELLRKGHYDVTLDRAEFIRLVTWIDSGAPFYGSYFGRRNLKYLGQPDFRPVPTLSSALGAE